MCVTVNSVQYLTFVFADVFIHLHFIDRNNKNDDSGITEIECKKCIYEQNAHRSQQKISQIKTRKKNQVNVRK